MGMDEHGPAYPEHDPANVKPFHDLLDRRIFERVYHCPICAGDKDRFFNCEYPGCLDGRDRGHPYARLIETYDGPAPVRQTTARWLVGVAVVVALVLWALWPRPAPAMDHGFNPNSATTQWFERLQRPNMPGSCCGKADAYPVEGWETNPDGSMTAIIGIAPFLVYPDGYERPFLAEGTRVPVPKELVNKIDDDLDNPTDVSWIFIAVYGGEVDHVYCFIRHPSGN